jgi:prepilin-type N-terminal cleavage/methylation domain-containing protein
MKNNRSGFTLIELLVVVLIIGILAAIAIPQYFAVVEKGRSVEGLSCIDVLRGAEERYYASQSTYDPITETITETLTGLNTTSGLDTTCAQSKFFTGTAIGTATDYTITLIRAGEVVPCASLSYGCYTLSYTHVLTTPDASPAITCTPAAGKSPCTDLVPAT